MAATFTSKPRRSPKLPGMSLKTRFEVLIIDRPPPVIPETVRNEPSDAGILRNRLNILNFHDNDLFAGLGVTASSEQSGYTQKE